ncbi:MAG: hypothetical protein Q4G54_12545 [Pelistega sp.]|nr:hypothetical protein [Pelistega sp.]
MKNILQVIEGYGPQEMGEDGVFFDALCSALDLYSRNKVYTVGVKKLMIHFVFSNNTQKDSEVLNIANIYIDVTDSVVFTKEMSFQEKMRANIALLESALEKFSEQHSCDTKTLFDAIAYMREVDFDFNGIALKKKSQDLSVILSWNFGEYLEYFLEINYNGQISKYKLMKKKERILNHKKLFKSIIIKNNCITVVSALNQSLTWMVNADKQELLTSYKNSLSGDEEDRFELARMYLNGHIVGKDEEKALNLLNNLAHDKHSKALNLLKKINS